MVRRVTGYGRGAAAVDLAPVPQKSNGIPTGSTAYDFGQLIRNTATGTWYIYSGGTTYDAIGGGSGQVSTISGNSGTATPSAGNIGVVGTGSITTTASGSTDTISLTGLTNHAVLVGAGTATITKLAVGSTGQVLIGATGADPAWGALGVNSGLTAHGVLVGEGNSAIAALAVGSTGTVLAGSTGADPAFTANPSVTSLTASGDVKGASITASGDAGGAASTIQLSNVNSSTISTGDGAIKMSSANPGTNTAWLKLYIGTSAFWLPAWTTNAP